MQNRGGGTGAGVGISHNVGSLEKIAHYTSGVEEQSMQSRKMLIPFLAWQIGYPDNKVHGVNMGPTHLWPTGHRCAPCGPREPCYLGIPSEENANMYTQLMYWKIWFAKHKQSSPDLWFRQSILFDNGMGNMKSLINIRDMALISPDGYPCFQCRDSTNAFKHSRAIISIQPLKKWSQIPRFVRVSILEPPEFSTYLNVSQVPCMEGFVAIVYTTSAILRFGSFMMRGAICINDAPTYYYRLIKWLFIVKYIPITLNMPFTHRHMYHTSKEVILVGKKHYTLKQVSLVQSHKSQYQTLHVASCLA